MFKFGLKLWSINIQYQNEVEDLCQKGCVDFIELLTIPGSYKKYISFWLDLKRKMNISFVIHAPHFLLGLNLADKNSLKRNKKLAKEAFLFANSLESEIIIFHPGTNGKDNETVSQLKMLNDSRIVIENKPYYSIKKNAICNGFSPESIKTITQKTGCGFCLDIGHAICAANALEFDPFFYIGNFLKLDPVIYHLTDGNFNSPYDRHDHLGYGNYNLDRIIKMLPANQMITLETEKNDNKKLDDYFDDIIYIKNIMDGK